MGKVKKHISSSPRGLGIKARDCKLGTIKKGADGNKWKNFDRGDKWVWRRHRPPLVLIDTASLSITRYNATIASLNFSRKANGKQPFNSKDNLFSDEEFMAAYDKSYMTHLGLMEKATGVSSSTFVWCRECRGKPWRYKYFADYKTNRAKDIEKDAGWGPVVKWTNDELIPRIPGYKMLRIDKCEGDDLIGVICKWERKHHPFRKVYIISQDKDHLQLSDEYVKILGPRLQMKPGTKSKKPYLDINTKGLDGKTLLITKIIVGDSSDKIPSCGLRIDKKNIQEYIDDPDKLMARVEKYDAMERFELNRLLIDYDYIPKKLQRRVIRGYKALFDKDRK